MNSQLIVIMALALTAEGPPSGVALRSRLILDLASDKLEIGDPVFVKVTLINLDRQPLNFPDEFGSNTMVIRFDLRAEGKEWQEIATIDRAVVGRRTRRQELVVNPQQSYCAYPALDLGLAVPPGRYEMRSRAAGTGFELSSIPKPFALSTATEAKLEFIRAQGRQLFGRLTVGSGSAMLDEIAPINFERLPPGFVRRHLEGTEAFVRWQRAPLGNSERTALENLIRLVDSYDPVMRERYLLGVAGQFHVQKRYEPALKTLDKLPNPSRESVWMRGAIEAEQNANGLP